jgi:hypothetical protein
MSDYRTVLDYFWQREGCHVTFDLIAIVSGIHTHLGIA